MNPFAYVAGWLTEKHALARSIDHARRCETRAVTRAVELAKQLDDANRRLAAVSGERDRARGVLIAVTPRLDADTAAMIRGALGTIEAL